MPTVPTPKRFEALRPPYIFFNTACFLKNPIQDLICAFFLRISCHMSRHLMFLVVFPYFYRRYPYSFYFSILSFIPCVAVLFFFLPFASFLMSSNLPHRMQAHILIFGPKLRILFYIAFFIHLCSLYPRTHTGFCSDRPFGGTGASIEYFKGSRNFIALAWFNRWHALLVKLVNIQKCRK